MKIVVIGAGGTVGRAVCSELASRHDIIEVGRNSGSDRVDMRDIASVHGLFARIGAVDAVVVTAGSVHFGPLAQMTPGQFGIGIADKLMGQVNVVLAGQSHLRDGGSFTLTSGILSEEPVALGANAATVNAAIEGFVRGAAVELQRGLRINAVSPTVLTDSLEAYGPYMRGFDAVDNERVARAYVKSIEGAQSGRTYRVW